VQTSDIKTLYAFHYWANHRILAQCAKLNTEQLQTKVSPDARTLHGTLVHQLDTEWGWRLRIEDLPDPGEMSEADLPTVAAIQARWEQDEREMLAYINRLSDEQLNGVIRYPVNDGWRERVLWHVLVHIVNHSTQHRSEVAILLTNAGFSPGEMDFNYFLHEQGSQPS
jgi:uncharacterized damage-inducible protein DinB